MPLDVTTGLLPLPRTPFSRLESERKAGEEGVAVMEGVTVPEQAGVADELGTDRLVLSGGRIGKGLAVRSMAEGVARPVEELPLLPPPKLRSKWRSAQAER